jgi:hypothetical protein
VDVTVEYDIVSKYSVPAGQKEHSVEPSTNVVLFVEHALQISRPSTSP